MRVSRSLCLLVSVLVYSTANGQSPEIDEVNAEWLKTCLADWDSATHMTKNEWAIACRRLSVEPAERGDIAEGTESRPIDRPPRKGTRGYLGDEP
jgi:hypothetical protein